MTTLRIGSRDSALAVAQTRIVMEALRRLDAGLALELVTMKTSGDLILDRPLDREGGKGLFTRELDRALLDRRIDLAVHSLKDIPAALPAGLDLAAFYDGVDPRDALVLPAGVTAPSFSKPLGCAGGRRETQLAALFPGWPCALVRGNVTTRLEKLDRGEYGGLVLAAAGLERLGLAARISRIFEPEELLPAAGQGILACVTRAGHDCGLAALLAALEAAGGGAARLRALAERAFVKTLDSGCGTPVAAFAEIAAQAAEERTIRLRGYYAPAGAPGVSGEISGGAARGEELGTALAYRLLTAWHQSQGRRGSVILAGAGPGDSGLLTLKADRALAEAGVVVYDKLTGKGALARIPAEAEKIYAGKESGHHTMTQQEINGLLIKKAAAGAKVVRLKGGDPYLFGRGGEEALALREAGIPFEVIPGVSSALAAPAAAGIPVTQRDVSGQVHIIAAYSSSPRKLEYAALARASGTLVFLMGVEALDTLCRSLIKAGLPPDTPAAIIERGTTAEQRVLTAAVSDIAVRAARLGIGAPAVTVIGAVCALRERLAENGAKPLAGIRIAVTRPRSRPSALAALLAVEGAEVIELPVITITARQELPELERALEGPHTNKWFAFTSVHGVEIFFEKLRAYHTDIRGLAGARFAAAGKAVSEALEERGIRVECAAAGSAELARALTGRCSTGETIALPRSALGGKALPQALAAAGLRCNDIPLYDTTAAPGYEDAVYRRLLVEGLEWAAFTSASTVEQFTTLFGDCLPEGIKALCIGETTAQAAAARGFRAITARQTTLEGMLKALIYSVHGESAV